MNKVQLRQSTVGMEITLAALSECLKIQGWREENKNDGTTEAISTPQPVWQPWKTAKTWRKTWIQENTYTMKGET